MKNILITGSAGQIGSKDGLAAGPFEVVDVTDRKTLYETARKYRVDTIIHLAALLSATAEAKPMFAWELNMGGLMNALETARELGCQFFTPSSIGVFGPTSPKDRTPQVTIQRPVTMYGVNKVAGELLCDYYHHKFGLDTRGLRFPGLISYLAPPGGGTTDYAWKCTLKRLKRRVRLLYRKRYIHGHDVYAGCDRGYHSAE